jgi:hypothetical protein
MSDMATQTEFETPATSPTGVVSNGTRKMADIAEDTSIDVRTQDISTMSSTPVTNDIAKEPTTESEKAPKQSLKEETKQDVRSSPIDDADPDDEEPVIVQTVQTAATPQFINRARLVSVKKAVAPQLPPRNPVRDRGKPLIIGGPAASRSDNSSSQDEDSSVKRPSTERTRSHDSMTSVDLDERDGKVSNLPVSGTDGRTPGDDKDEFHSTSSTPAIGSPRLRPVDAEGSKITA